MAKRHKPTLTEEEYQELLEASQGKGKKAHVNKESLHRLMMDFSSLLDFFDEPGTVEEQEAGHPDV